MGEHSHWPLSSIKALQYGRRAGKWKIGCCTLTGPKLFVRSTVEFRVPDGSADDYLIRARCVKTD